MQESKPTFSSSLQVLCVCIGNMSFVEYAQGLLSPALASRNPQQGSHGSRHCNLPAIAVPTVIEAENAPWDKMGFREDRRGADGGPYFQNSYQEFRFIPFVGGFTAKRTYGASIYSLAGRLLIN